MRSADRQILFDVGDEVSFLARGKGRLQGTVRKLNPTRARVRSDADDWDVPYGGLHHVCNDVSRKRGSRLGRLKEVDAEARKLMDGHGLADWSFGFNDAEKKLGVCRYREGLILLGRRHAAEGAPDQVTDTILHEIAHALAGPEARHGPAWKAVARQLGATPKSCAPESGQTRDRREKAKAKFRVGDTVNFEYRGQPRTGVIERMNAKRAKVRCLGTAWAVPYTRLQSTQSP